MTPVKSDPSDSTASSLLHRVKQRDGEAWSRFAKVYTPLVYGWARRGGLQQNDAADIVQDVFRTVFDKIDDFRHEGASSNFRGWLWAITRNRVRLFYRQAGPRPDAVGGSDAAHQMQQVPDLFESESDPSNANEQAAILDRALQLIRNDFSEQSWDAFRRVAIGGESATDVAADLGLSPSAVRQAKYRVLCRLRDEMAGM